MIAGNVGFAIVGCGRIAQRYLDLLGNKKIRGAKLVAVSDISESRAKKAGSKGNIPYYYNMHDMMERHRMEIDIVCVLTESGSHAAHAMALASYGKHLVVEKPMALTLDDADAMIRTCELNGVRLFVVKQNRFNLPIVKLREALEEGRFGKLVMGTIRVRWCRTQTYYNQDPWRGTLAFDGGVLSNQASHHIDMLQWMMGKPERVYGVTRTALVDIEAEDTSAGIIQFNEGSLGLVEATTATRPKDIESSISILGEKGAVEIAGFAMNEMKVWQFEEQRRDDNEILKNCRENSNSIYGFGHQRYLDHVVNAVLNNRPCLVDGREARKSLELTIALCESAAEGREVLLNQNL
jgi:UDP-N-acetyl-2-amino-2-deoxyglucuronate dehydrogenase